MPTVLTPSSPAVFPASLSGPADGELANAASVNGPFQVLLTGTEASRLSLLGRKAAPRYRCDDGATIVVEALGWVVLTTGGVWKAFENTVSSSFDAATKFGGALVLNTRYYIYAYDNAGTIDFAVTTDAPDARLYYRSGGLTGYAFVGTFIYHNNALAVTMIAPFRSYGGFYAYDEPMYIGTTNLGGGGTGVTVQLTCAGTGLYVVPSYSKCCHVGYQISDSAGATTAFQAWRRPGSAVWTGGFFFVVGTSVRKGYDSNVDQFPYNDNNEIELAKTGVATTDGLLFVYGFYDGRN